MPIKITSAFEDCMGENGTNSNCTASTE